MKTINEEKDHFFFTARKNFSLKQGRRYLVLFDGTILIANTGIEED